MICLDIKILKVIIIVPISFLILMLIIEITMKTCSSWLRNLSLLILTISSKAKRKSLMIFRANLLSRKGFKNQLTKVHMIMMVFRIVTTDMIIAMKVMTLINMIVMYFDVHYNQFKALLNFTIFQFFNFYIFLLVI